MERPKARLPAWFSAATGIGNDDPYLVRAEIPILETPSRTRDIVAAVGSINFSR